MSNTWLQVAQEALKIPGLLVEIYGDLAKPGVQQVGKALGTVFGLGNTVLWPVHLANERSRMYLERNLEDYRMRLHQVDLEKIVPVTPEIGVPIAEKLTYVRDTKLADMYLSILEKAANGDHVSEAHPSFVNIINNLSSDDALLLEYFVTDPDLEFVAAKWWSDRIYSFAGDLLISPKHSSNLLLQTLPTSKPAGLGLVLSSRRVVSRNNRCIPSIGGLLVSNFRRYAPKSDRTI